MRHEPLQLQIFTDGKRSIAPFNARSFTPRGNARAILT
jgi:hypothetical protein